MAPLIFRTLILSLVHLYSSLLTLVLVQDFLFFSLFSVSGHSTPMPIHPGLVVWKGLYMAEREQCAFFLSFRCNGKHTHTPTTL
ncbi:MAG: hypothetical protein J3R72DRAFT_460288 [Linnemannia gamsii]|nr:MAG: hypothetical protein J3R72DRAFT_460288 [Linnemannia gamsii]